MSKVDWDNAPDGAMRHNKQGLRSWLRKFDGCVEYYDTDTEQWERYLRDHVGNAYWRDATPRPSRFDVGAHVSDVNRVGVMSDGEEVTLVAANDSDCTPTTKRRYYIAGPVTGYESTYRDVFNAMSDTLSAQGHVILNPATLPAGLTQGQYMDICTAMLRCVTHVKMLKGWERSEGARIEHALAIKSDLTVEYE